MKRTVFSSLALVAVCCLFLFVPGCPSGDRSDKSAGTAAPSGDAHTALQVSLHVSKQGEATASVGIGDAPHKAKRNAGEQVHTH
ncbi:MAG: hypothetical protein FWE95_07645 [Planctomycetaceae bacterium]|nr:hypothetical protein [Planctomycetaceae bacterium]